MPTNELISIKSWDDSGFKKYIPKSLKEPTVTNFYIPSQWEDIPEKVRYDIMPFVLPANLGNINAKWLILKAICTYHMKRNGVSAKNINISFNSMEVAWVFDQMEFLYKWSNYKSPFNSIRIDGKAYYYPSNHFGNINAGEFIVLMDLYTDFTTNYNPKSTDDNNLLPLYKMLGVVLRPRAQKLDALQEAYDKRQSFDDIQSKALAFNRAKLFMQKLGASYLLPFHNNFFETLNLWIAKYNVFNTNCKPTKS